MSLYLISSDSEIEERRKSCDNPKIIDAIVRDDFTTFMAILRSIQGQDAAARALTLESRTKDTKKRTSLITAVMLKRKCFVKELLNAGADVNARDSKDSCALIECLKRRNFDKDVFNLLLDYSCSLSSSQPSRIVSMAVRSCDPLSLQRLVNSLGPKSIEIHDKSGWSPLHIAISFRPKEIAETLISLGCEVNDLAKNNWSCLHLAATNGLIDHAQVLLMAGANTNSIGQKGRTPLHCAAESSKLKMVQILVENNADVNQKCDLGWTSLFWAMVKPNMEVLEYLLVSGADPMVLTNNGESIVDIAMHYNHGFYAEWFLGKKVRSKVMENVTGLKAVSQLINKLADKAFNTYTVSANPGVLVSILDSHIGDLSLDDFEAQDVHLEFDLSLEFESLRDKLKALDQPKLVFEQVNSAQLICERNRHIDVTNALKLISNSLDKHTLAIVDDSLTLSDIQATETQLRIKAQDAQKDFESFEKLSSVKQYMDALIAEDNWMLKILDLIDSKSLLLREIDKLLQKHSNLGQMLNNAYYDCSDLQILEHKRAMLKRKCESLEMVSVQLSQSCDVLREEWKQIPSYVEKFLELSPSNTVDGMIEYYLDFKKNQINEQITHLKVAISIVEDHFKVIEHLNNCFSQAFHHSCTKVQSNINLLRGYYDFLNSEIPNLYNSLHLRLLSNEKLCKKNIMEMQEILQQVLLAKNSAFESRRISDLSTCEEKAATMQNSLENEKSRLEKIENLIHRAFNSISPHVSQNRIDEIRSEFMELGLCLRLGGKKTRKSITPSKKPKLEESLSQKITSFISAMTQWRSEETTK